MEEIEHKIIKYFDIPYEFTKSEEHLVNYNYPDSFTSFALEPKGENKLCDWLREKYPESENALFVIYFNY